MKILVLGGVMAVCMAVSVNAFGSAPSWGDPVQGIRCSVDVQSPVWAKGSPATVIVSIENQSSSSKELDVISDFTLGAQYWAPVEVSDTSRPLPANTTFRLSIQPFQVLSFKIDLAELKWAKNISSVWPGRELFSTVPSGTYSLRYAIYFGTNTNPNWVQSNPVEVAVR